MKDIFIITKASGTHDDISFDGEYFEYHALVAQRFKKLN